MPGADAILKTVSDLAERAIDRLPGPQGGATKNELLILKELLMDARPPKLMILGRRGAGKSSLINAIFGERMAAVGSVLSETGRPTWYSYRTGTVHVNGTVSARTGPYDWTLSVGRGDQPSSFANTPACNSSSRHAAERQRP